MNKVLKKASGVELHFGCKLVPDGAFSDLDAETNVNIGPVDIDNVIQEFPTLMYKYPKFNVNRGYDSQIVTMLNIQVDEKGEIQNRVTVCSFGDPLDELWSMCISRKHLKLKTSITLVPFDDKTKLIQIISREGSPTTFVDGNEYEFYSRYVRYEFKDDVTVNIRPHVWMRRKFEATITYEVIANEVAFYGLKLPLSSSRGKRALEDGIHCDFEFEAKNGTKIPCHKVYIASSSSVFQGMLSSGMTETKNNVCKLEMSAEGIHALLQYIYYSAVGAPMKKASVAYEMLEAGHKYNIDGLEKAMKQIFHGKPEEWYTVEVAMRVFIWGTRLEGYDDVKTKAVKVLKSKRDEVMKTTLFDELIVQNPNAFKEMFLLA